MSLVLALLRRAHLEARDRGADLSVVTIPYIPAQSEVHSPDFVVDMENYGLLLDEQELARGLQESGIPVLKLGTRLAEQRPTVAELDTLYIAGQGHLTTDGHDWVAREVCTHLFSTCLGDR